MFPFMLNLPPLILILIFFSPSPLLVLSVHPSFVAVSRRFGGNFGRTLVGHWWDTSD